MVGVTMNSRKLYSITRYYRVPVKHWYGWRWGEWQHSLFDELYDYPQQAVEEAERYARTTLKWDIQHNNPTPYVSVDYTDGNGMQSYFSIKAHRIVVLPSAPQPPKKKGR